MCVNICILCITIKAIQLGFIEYLGQSIIIQSSIISSLEYEIGTTIIH